MERKRVFSGSRPSGRLHLGNYLGAVENWVKMQHEYDCVFAIVDHHAITTPFDPRELQTNTRDMLVDLLAVGLDPSECTLVIQSELPQHTELAWILGSITPIGWLQRVPTFKEKSEMHPDNVNLGLLSYPVLQAADILLYKAEVVPVGEDQLPHVELAREIVRRFNHRFGDTFPEPEAEVPRHTARIMSLTEPEKKMSKSLGPDSYISIGDDPETVKEKVMKAVTDTGPTSGEMSPGVANLFTLLREFGDEKQHREFLDEYEEGIIRYVDLKEATAAAIIDTLQPVRKRRQKLLQSPQRLREIMETGHERASTIACTTLREVKERTGLGPGREF